MQDIQSQFVKNILSAAPQNQNAIGKAFAPSNIALCKYWGKRDPALNLPLNSSLSISLGSLGTHTEIRLRDLRDEAVASTKISQGTSSPVEATASSLDTIYLNGELQAETTLFAQRISAFLDLFRFRFGNAGFEVRTENNIPTAAGLASSASGFAALTLALNNLGGWELSSRQLSMLARLGSGSASRSLFQGFVQWHAGERADGTDSFAERLALEWPAFRIGILELSSAVKPVGSRDGMNRTVKTSTLYKSWPSQAEKDLKTIRRAIEHHDFQTLGKTAEQNALSMHATMLSAWPPLMYLQPETVKQIHEVQRLRAEGLELYLTMDAGPNIKLLFLKQSEDKVVAAFPSVQIIKPF